MHAGRGFLRNAAPILHDLMPAIRILTVNFEQQIFDDLLLSIRGFGFCPIAAFLELVAFVNEQRGVAAVIRSEEHTSELQSHSDLHSFPTLRSSDLCTPVVVSSETPRQSFTISCQR